MFGYPPLTECGYQFTCGVVKIVHFEGRFHNNKEFVARVFFPSIMILHMWSIFGWLSDQTLFHSRDCFTSIFICNWIPFENQVTNTICGSLWLVAKLWLNFKDRP